MDIKSVLAVLGALYALFFWFYAIINGRLNLQKKIKTAYLFLGVTIFIIVFLLIKP